MKPRRTRRALADWGGDDGGRKSHARLVAVVIALIVLMASVVVALVFFFAEQSNNLAAERFRVDTAADSLQNSMQAAVDEMISDLTALGRLYDASCVRASKSTLDPLFNIEPVEFKHYALAAVRSNPNLGSFVYAPIVRNNAERIHVEDTVHDFYNLQLRVPTYTLIPPYSRKSRQAVPYDNQTLVITALVEPFTGTAALGLMADIRLLTRIAKFQEAMPLAHQAAISGEARATTLIKNTFVVLPLYTCGHSHINAALFPDPALSPVIAGYIGAAYVTTDFITDKFGPFVALQPEYHVDVEEIGDDHVYTGGAELPENAEELLTTSRIVSVTGVEWRLTVTQVASERYEVEQRLTYLLLAMPLALGALAAIAIVGAAFSQHSRNARATKMTMEAMDATHQYVVAFVCHEMRNPLHACMAYIDLAMGSVQAEAEDGESQPRTPVAAAGSPEELESAVQDLQSAKAAADQVTQVLDAVMDIRRLNHGDLKVNPAHLGNVSDVLRDLSNQYRYLLDPAVQLTLHLENCEGMVDRMRLRQVLAAGLHSATRATSEGCIALCTTKFSLPRGSCACRNVLGTSPPSFMAATHTLQSYSDDDDIVLVDDDAMMLDAVHAIDDPNAAYQRPTPWLLCEVLSTPSAELPRSVVRWDKEQQSMSRPPAAIRERVQTDCVPPGEGELGGGSAYAIPTASGSTMTHKLSAWSGLTAAAAKRNNVSTGRQGREVVRHLRKKAGSGITLELCARVVKAMDGYMGIHTDSNSRVRFWVAIPLRVHGSSTQSTTGSVDASSSLHSGVLPGSTLHSKSGEGGERWGHSPSPQRMPHEVARTITPSVHPDQRISVVEVSEVQEIDTRPASSLAETKEAPEGTEAKPSAPVQAANAPVEPSQPDVIQPPPPKAEPTAAAPKAAQEPVVVAAVEAPPTFIVAVVDDEPVVRKTTGRFLKKLGHTAVIFDDGVPLVEAMLTNDNPDGIQVILLDIIMRNSNGVEVCKALRGSGVTLPIVAMTGNVDPASLELYAEVGFTTVMGKPFNKKKLKATLADVAPQE